MDSSYAEVGTEVVIGFGSSFYSYGYHMERYLRRKTTIVEVGEFRVGSRPANACCWCLVKADGMDHWWPVQDMILASDVELLTPAQAERIR